MSAFDNLMDRAREVASLASKKTGTAVELSKLKLQSMQIRSQMQSTYERIGILVYEQEKTGTDNHELMSVCIQEVDALMVRLNEINVQISLIKDGVRCPNCDTSNPVDTAYCKSCGAIINKK